VTLDKHSLPEFLLGLGLIAIAAVIGIEANSIRVAPIYAKVGPAAFLWLAAIILALCGIVLARKALKAHRQEVPEIDNRGMLAIVTGLVLQVLLFERIGFIPTATLLFVLTAYGLGSRRLVRDIIIAVIIAVAAFLVFNSGLGLRLPTGTFFS
jgi:putative tricarboxylic transport membrane protein